MSSVGRSWGQWASDVASRAGELAESAAETTEAALKDAYEDSPVEVAVDYWATHSPEQVTREFRNSTDEFVSERLGETAGKAARLATVPLGAAARFSVQGVQGFDAVASKATDIATGRAAMPTPGEVIAGTAVGVINYAKQTADAAGNAMVDGAIAVVRGDVEGVAAATENAAKAALDVGVLVAGGRGVVGAKSTLGGGGVMRAAGVGTTFAVGTRGALAAAGQVGVSVGALGVMSQAPMEARGRKAHASGDGPKATKPREKLIELPKKKTPEATPKGKPERHYAKNDNETRESIERQNTSADDLAKAGFDVEHRPKPPGDKKPDLKVNGKIFDVYSPQFGTPVQNIRASIHEKVSSTQTRRVVVNLDRSQVRPAAIGEELKRTAKYEPDLVEVLTIRKGHVRRVFP
ncbi:MAG: hypothetical protein AAF219_11195 [Myxococcota bacterium]